MKKLKPPNYRQQSILDTIAFLEQQLAKWQVNIDQHIDNHPRLKEDRDLLTSIPAVGAQVGSHLLAVLHNHPFRSAGQFAALVPQRVYLGLVPVERQSGSSIKGRPRLSFMPCGYNPHLQALYQRLQANGKSKMSTLGAVIPSGAQVRKLAHLCFGVLKTRNPYQPDYLILS